MTYASPIWITAAISNRKRLQTTQNKCLNDSWALHRKSAMPSINEFVGKLNSSFNNKCAESGYDLIRALAT